MLERLVCILAILVATTAPARDAERPEGIHCRSDRNAKPEYWIKALKTPAGGFDVTVVRRTLGQDVDVFRPEAFAERSEQHLTIHLSGELTADLLLVDHAEPRKLSGVLKLETTEVPVECRQIGNF